MLVSSKIMSGARLYDEISPPVACLNCAGCMSLEHISRTDERDKEELRSKKSSIIRM